MFVTSLSFGLELIHEDVIGIIADSTQQDSVCFVNSGQLHSQHLLLRSLVASFDISRVGVVSQRSQEVTVSIAHAHGNEMFLNRTV